MACASQSATRWEAERGKEAADGAHATHHPTFGLGRGTCVRVVVGGVGDAWQAEAEETYGFSRD
eukprot:CAMPEP_0114119098 /NCGR_PEP_ID=MMETSP0043_2-20121206/5933_1 /TAXON_ID=464988 /ORGANISM="Hemiselmis andersenii, Strain CCMP644" /LENGTH=63 /DNA_ID=CAMNT_0001211629 /DNA_START=334 /DNA_END=525 /DNA_ORIENTATION=-